MAGRWFIQINTRAKLRRELERGSAFSRYEQFDTSPETTEQELRPAGLRTATDRFKENYSIDSLLAFPLQPVYRISNFELPTRSYRRISVNISDILLWL